MTDHISREAAIKAAMQDTGFHRTHEFNAGCARAANNLRAIPAADVAPVVHGRWVYNPGDNIPYCSECMMPQDSECNYCPNCGAKMDGGDNDDQS